MEAKLDHEEEDRGKDDAFEVWVWREFLRMLWTARKIKKEIFAGNEIIHFVRSHKENVKMRYF